MINSKSAKMTLRLLSFLKVHKFATGTPFQDGSSSKLMLSAQDGARILCVLSDLDSLHRAALVEGADGRWCITPLGLKRLKRASVAAKETDAEAFQNQHREFVEKSLNCDGQARNVKVNSNESPLGRLKNRKMASGQPWISDDAYEAGERLRRDFTRGQLVQKVTSSWDPSAGSNKSKGSAGGKTDLSDSAIDARARLQKAIDFVGPDLGCVLTDVCCFLKGLELVERERQWPPRSAKLMLRTGLELLARHYGLGPNAGKNAGALRSWGGEGYRPAIKY